MALSDVYINILTKIPGITEPVQRLAFKGKLKWTGLMLIIYFAMAQITVYGVAPGSFEQLRQLEILLGSSFGSLMTLGIGPIVTASIILQLMTGSKIIPWDLQTEKGKMMFQGTQKLFAVILSVVEAGIYVSFGAVGALPGFEMIVILQLALGGIIVIFMDEVISKWGFGSGISLFIVAGVSKTIIVRMFNPLTQAGTLPTAGNPSAGIIPFAISAIGAGEPFAAMLSMLPIVATVLVFLLVVYANAIKVEIPLAFGSVRGFGRRWPLKFFYTSNIPVILVAALLANVQLFGRMLAQQGWTFLATLDSQGNISGGLILFLIAPNNQALSILMITIGVFALLGAIATYYTRREGVKLVVLSAALGAVVWYIAVSATGLTSLVNIPLMDAARAFTYSIFMMGGAMMFALFWVTTSGMDAGSVARQIQSTGMQIPGYRRDIRIMERVLNRYIPGLTILGGVSVGFLASFADFTGALGTGTGILLATLIIQNLYEELAMKHMEDMHPSMRKFFGKQ
jgi:preprotein translocase subunit SecY